MGNLPALKREETSTGNQAIYDQLEAKIGMVPNLYATYAHSPVALKSILEFGETLQGGGFTAREVEAIALAVSETNNCEYCLAAHTALGKMAGFSVDETIALRTATIEDEKLRALVNLAQSIAVQRGRPEQSLVDNFFTAGYGKDALVELIGFVAVNTFNNYLNNVAGTEVDFPAAPELVAV